MNTPRSRATFDEARRHLETLDEAFVPIQNPPELHLFEVYAALAFRT